MKLITAGTVCSGNVYFFINLVKVYFTVYLNEKNTRVLQVLLHQFIYLKEAISPPPMFEMGTSQ